MGTALGTVNAVAPVLGSVGISHTQSSILTGSVLSRFSVGGVDQLA